MIRHLIFGMDAPTSPAPVALVAGASRGIGAETAKALALAGYAVVLGARDTDALDRVVHDIESSGGHAVATATDVGDVDSMRSLVRLAVRLVRAPRRGLQQRDRRAHAGAVGRHRPGRVRPRHPHQRPGTFLGMKFQIPAMLESGGGAIVNMASVAGVRAMTNLAAYVAGKAAIIGLTEVAALDYADQGIRVNVVAPGPILTHHLERAGDDARTLAGRSVPMGRIGTTAEVADAVLWPVL
jgi:NAD(P)-dependent dehydrogenase (short-subunit alcohol dehydrogenase family)